MAGMFIGVSVILARVEFAVLLLDKEEEGCLEGVGQMNLSGSQVFLKKVFGSFLFVRRKQVDFDNLWYK